MNLFEKYRIETSKSLDEILLSLNEIKNDYKFSLFQGTKLFTGKISNDKFWLYKTIYGRGFARVIAKGKFEMINEKLVIEFQLLPRIFSSIIIFTFLSIPILFIIYLNIISEKIKYGFNIIGIFLIIILSTILYLSIKSEKESVELKLLQIFRNRKP